MYRHRLMIILLVALAGTGLLLGRSAELQLRKRDASRHEAQRMLESYDVLECDRGKIRDRNGEYLAEGAVRYQLCMDYRLLRNDPDWIEDQILEIASEEVVSLGRAQEIFNARVEATWRLARHLAEQQGVDIEGVCGQIISRVERIRQRVGMPVRLEFEYHPVVTGLLREADTQGTVGIRFRPVRERHYPHGAAACHLIGLIGRVSEAEMERYNLPEDQASWTQRIQANYLGEDYIGKSGVELLAESVLRGRRGYEHVRRVQTERRVLERVEAQPGGDVRMTIDIDLQEAIEDRFRQMAPDRNGAAVVIDVNTGDILAMVSIPTYDLNTYRQELPRLMTDERDFPLHNRAATRLYPPGSIAKPISLLAGLTAGVVTPSTTYTCRGYLHQPGAFRCWNRSGHGPLDARGAIKNSCNIYFYHVGELVGVNLLRSYFESFGFGQLPGTGLPGESAGQVGRTVRPNERGETRYLAIGQGRFEATPLQCANAMATIARNGMFISPRLVYDAGPEQTHHTINASQEHIGLVQQGMYDVCNALGGTAYRVFHGNVGAIGLGPLGFEVSGKTGTAEVPPQRLDEDGDGVAEIIREGDMAWFGGYGPSAAPQVAVAVVVEYAGGGSRNAAPIAREIFRLCRQFGYIQ
jgi:penicillin-binding protein 2